MKNIVGGIKVESRDSVDGIVTRLKAGRPSSRGSVPGKEKCVVVFTNLLYRPLDLSIFPLLRTWNFSPGLKRLEREVDHFPWSEKVKNEWSYISTTTICLHGVNRENFYL